MREIIYEYKGKQYRIFAESKIKIDGQWIDCIVYQTLYVNDDGWIWVRTKDDFFNNFKPFGENLDNEWITKKVLK